MSRSCRLQRWGSGEQCRDARLECDRPRDGRQLRPALAALAILALALRPARAEVAAKSGIRFLGTQ